MKRRIFLKASPAAAVCAGIQGCGNSVPKSPDNGSVNSKILKISPDGRLAGMPLKELRDKFHHDLYERLIPFFLKYMVDYEHGGFFPYLEIDGRSRSGDTKRAWWLGRGIWTMSYLYNHLDRKQVYLDIANKAADILIRNKPSGENFWPTPFDVSGVPAKEQARSLDEDMFAAEGLAELAEATGDDSHRALAKETLLKCLRRYDSPDYEHTATYDLDEKPLTAPRLAGHWMIFIITATKMLRYGDDPELLSVCDRCIDALFNYHLNPAYDLFNEVINHDLSRPDNSFSQFSLTSHAIEALWMVMWEAERRCDSELFLKASGLFKRHVQVSWDDVYGGIFTGVNHVDLNIWRLDKQQWVHVEALVGCLLYIEHSSDSWARNMYGRMYNYFQSVFSLEESGCPLWLLGGNRDLTTKRIGTGGYYHNARWLMLSLQMLDRMLERDGKVSGLLS